MIDELQAFIDLLATDPVFAPLVTTNGRVWVVGPGGLANIQGVPPKAVVVETGSGTVRGDAPIIAPVYSLRCYGPTLFDAQDVARNLYGVFYYTSGDFAGQQKPARMVNSRYMLYSASISSLSAPVNEPVSQWPVAYRSVRCQWSALTGA